MIIPKPFSIYIRGTINPQELVGGKAGSADERLF